MSRRPLVLLVGLAVLGLLAPVAHAGAKPAVVASLGTDAGARELLARAFEGPTHPIAGTVAVVVLDDDGPFVSELDVTATPSGEMVVGRSRSFAVGRDGDNAYLARDGTLLQLGVVVGGDDPLAVLATYRAHQVERTTLDTGPADGVDLFDVNDVRRERLWIDLRSGIVVRRETFDLGGRLRRLVAFTEVTLVAPAIEASARPPAGNVLDTGPLTELEPDALLTLAKTGWHVPDALPGDFALSRGFALDNGEGRSSLHLVYSDGLYSLSIYQQPGEMAEAAVDGAVWVEHDGMQVWRWPGAQPERLVWSAQGMTFTAIGDATPDRILASLVPLPRGDRDGAGNRVRRGFARLGSWLNPFA